MLSDTTLISLREISAVAVRSICALGVAPDQKKFGASNAVSIAQAYFEPKAWFRAIHAKDTQVGLSCSASTRASPNTRSGDS